MDLREWFEKLVCVWLPSHHLRVPLERLRGVKVGEDTKIGQFTMIIGAKNLSIGKDCFIGKYCVIDALREPITIGNHVTMAGRVSILSHDTAYMSQLGIQTGQVTIEDEAYLGHGVIVLRNVTIGEGSIVGAGAVVTKNIPDGEVWVGVPAQFLKKVKT